MTGVTHTSLLSPKGWVYRVSSDGVVELYRLGTPHKHGKIKPGVSIQGWILRRLEQGYLKVNVPPIEDLEFWSRDCIAEATDGCRVEPDGHCPHGHKSWLLVMGVI